MNNFFGVFFVTSSIFIDSFLIFQQQQFTTHDPEEPRCAPQHCLSPPRARALLLLEHVLRPRLRLRMRRRLLGPGERRLCLIMLLLLMPPFPRLDGAWGKRKMYRTLSPHTTYSG